MLTYRMQVLGDQVGGLGSGHLHAIQVREQGRLGVTADLDEGRLFRDQGANQREVPGHRLAQRIIRAQLDQGAREVHVPIARLDSMRARAVCGARDLSHEGNVLDQAADDDELSGLNVRADLDRELGQALQALRFVHWHLAYWCGGEELNLHVLADTSS